MAYSFTCAHCNTPFVHSNKNRKYCSFECNHVGRRKKQERTCEWCSVVYHATGKRNERFCSRECWNQDHAHKPKQSTCEICGQFFTQPPNYNRKTCSKVCADKATQIAQSQKVTSACEVCGKEFKRKPSRPGKFCSRACSSVGRDHPVKKKIAHQICRHCGESFQFVVKTNYSPEYCSRRCAYMQRTNAPVLITCEQCKREFNVPYPRRRQKFCGDTCYQEWHCGENHSLYTGENKNYYGKNWLRQRSNARKRDNYRCKHCGVTEKKLGRTLDVHHIKPFKTFLGDYIQANQITNLISLCAKCHKLAEHGKIPIQPVLL